MFLLRGTSPELDDDSEARVTDTIAKSRQLNWCKARAKCTWCESERKLHLGGLLRKQLEKPEHAGDGEASAK